MLGMCSEKGEQNMYQSNLVSNVHNFNIGLTQHILNPHLTSDVNAESWHNNDIEGISDGGVVGNVVQCISNIVNIDVLVLKHLVFSKIQFRLIFITFPVSL
ncbi:hypothetical protein ACJX0J_016107, partial [Zea mays]